MDFLVRVGVDLSQAETALSQFESRMDALYARSQARGATGGAAAAATVPVLPPVATAQASLNQSQMVTGDASGLTKLQLEQRAKLASAYASQEAIIKRQLGELVTQADIEASATQIYRDMVGYDTQTAAVKRQLTQVMTATFAEADAQFGFFSKSTTDSAAFATNVKALFSQIGLGLEAAAVSASEIPVALSKVTASAVTNQIIAAEAQIVKAKESTAVIEEEITAIEAKRLAAETSALAAAEARATQVAVSGGARSLTSTQLPVVTSALEANPVKGVSVDQSGKIVGADTEAKQRQVVASLNKYIASLDAQSSATSATAAASEEVFVGLQQEKATLQAFIVAQEQLIAGTTAAAAEVLVPGVVRSKGVPLAPVAPTIGGTAVPGVTVQTAVDAEIKSIGTAAEQFAVTLADGSVVFGGTLGEVRSFLAQYSAALQETVVFQQAAATATQATAVAAEQDAVNTEAAAVASGEEAAARTTAAGAAAAVGPTLGTVGRSAPAAPIGTSEGGPAARFAEGAAFSEFNASVIGATIKFDELITIVDEEGTAVATFSGQQAATAAAVGQAWQQYTNSVISAGQSLEIASLGLTDEIAANQAVVRTQRAVLEASVAAMTSGDPTIIQAELDKEAAVIRNDIASLERKLSIDESTVSANAQLPELIAQRNILQGRLNTLVQEEVAFQEGFLSVAEYRASQQVGRTTSRAETGAVLAEDPKQIKALAEQEKNALKQKINIDNERLGLAQEEFAADVTYQELLVLRAQRSAQLADSVEVARAAQLGISVDTLREREVVAERLAAQQALLTAARILNVNPPGQDPNTGRFTEGPGTQNARNKAELEILALLEKAKISEQFSAQLTQQQVDIIAGGIVLRDEERAALAESVTIQKANALVQGRTVTDYEEAFAIVEEDKAIKKLSLDNQRLLLRLQKAGVDVTGETVAEDAQLPELAAQRRVLQARLNAVIEENIALEQGYASVVEYRASQQVGRTVGRAETGAVVSEDPAQIKALAEQKKNSLKQEINVLNQQLGLSQEQFATDVTYQELLVLKSQRATQIAESVEVQRAAELGITVDTLRTREKVAERLAAEQAAVDAARVLNINAPRRNQAGRFTEGPGTQSAKNKAELEILTLLQQARVSQEVINQLTAGQIEIIASGNIFREDERAAIAEAVALKKANNLVQGRTVTDYEEALVILQEDKTLKSLGLKNQGLLRQLEEAGVQFVGEAVAADQSILGAKAQAASLNKLIAKIVSGEVQASTIVLDFTEANAAIAAGINADEKAIATARNAQVQIGTQLVDLDIESLALIKAENDLKSANVNNRLLINELTSVGVNIIGEANVAQTTILGAQQQTAALAEVYNKILNGEVDVAQITLDFTTQNAAVQGSILAQQESINAAKNALVNINGQDLILSEEGLLALQEQARLRKNTASIQLALNELQTAGATVIGETVAAQESNLAAVTQLAEINKVISLIKNGDLEASQIVLDFTTANAAIAAGINADQAAIAAISGLEVEVNGQRLTLATDGLAYIKAQIELSSLSLKNRQLLLQLEQAGVNIIGETVAADGSVLAASTQNSLLTDLMLKIKKGLVDTSQLTLDFTVANAAAAAGAVADEEAIASIRGVLVDINGQRVALEGEGLAILKAEAQLKKLSIDNAVLLNTLEEAGVNIIGQTVAAQESNLAAATQNDLLTKLIGRLKRGEINANQLILDFTLANAAAAAGMSADDAANAAIKGALVDINGQRLVLETDGLAAIAVANDLASISAKNRKLLLELEQAGINIVGQSVVAEQSALGAERQHKALLELRNQILKGTVDISALTLDFTAANAAATSGGAVDQEAINAILGAQVNIAGQMLSVEEASLASSGRSAQFKKQRALLDQELFKLELENKVLEQERNAAMKAQVAAAQKAGSITLASGQVVPLSYTGGTGGGTGGGAGAGGGGMGGGGGYFGGPGPGGPPSNNNGGFISNLINRYSGRQQAQTPGQFFGGGALSTLKYAVPSLVIFGALASIKGAIEESQKLEFNLTKIKEQLRLTGQESSFPEIKQQIFDLASATGVATSEVASLALQIQGAFGQDITLKGADQIERAGQSLVAKQLDAAAKLAVVSGIPEQELVDGLTAASQAFGVDAEVIGNVAVKLESVSGVLAKETVSFLGDIGPVAEAAGFSVEEFASIAALAQKKSGQAGSDLAEKFGRILPAITKNKAALLELASANATLATSTTTGSNGQVTDFVTAVGASDTRAIFTILNNEFKNLDKNSQEFIINLIGSRREAQALLSVFGDKATLDAYTKAAKDSVGVLDKRNRELQKSLTQVLKRIKQDWDQFVSAVLSAGLAEALGGIAVSFSTILKTVTGLVNIFNSVNEEIGGALSKLVAFAIQLSVINKLVSALGKRSLFAGLSASLTAPIFGGRAAIPAATSAVIPVAPAATAVSAGGYAGALGIPAGGAVAPAATAVSAGGYAGALGPAAAPAAGAAAQAGKFALSKVNPLLLGLVAVEGLTVWAEWADSQNKKAIEANQKLADKLRAGNKSSEELMRLAQSQSDIVARSFGGELSNYFAGLGEAIFEAFNNPIIRVLGGDLSALYENLLPKKARDILDKLNFPKKIQQAISEFFGGKKDKSLSPKQIYELEAVRKQLTKEQETLANNLSGNEEFIKFVNDEVIKLDDETKKKINDEIVNSIKEGKITEDTVLDVGKNDEIGQRLRDQLGYKGKFTAGILKALTSGDDVLQALTALRDSTKDKNALKDIQELIVILQQRGINDPEVKKLIDSLLAKDQVDQNALKVDAASEALASGQIDIETYKKIVDTNIENLKKALRAGWDPETQKALNELIVQRNKDISEAITKIQDDALELEIALDPGDDSKEAISRAQNALANLQNPDFADPEARTEAVKQFIEGARAFAIQYIEQTGDLAYAQKLLNEGVPLPPAVTAEIELKKTKETEAYKTLAKGYQAYRTRVRNSGTFLGKLNKDLTEEERAAKESIGELGPGGLADLITQEIAAGGVTDKTKKTLFYAYADAQKAAAAARQIANALPNDADAQKQADEADKAALYLYNLIQRANGAASIFDQGNTEVKATPEEVQTALTDADKNNRARRGYRTALANKDAVAAARIQKEQALKDLEIAKASGVEEARWNALANLEKANQAEVDAIKAINDAKRGYFKTLAELGKDSEGAALIDLQQAQADLQAAIAAKDKPGIEAAKGAIAQAQAAIRDSRIKKQQDLLKLQQAQLGNNPLEAAKIDLQIAQEALKNAKGDDIIAAQIAVISAEKAVQDQMSSLRKSRADLRRAEIANMEDDVALAMFDAEQARKQYQEALVASKGAETPDTNAARAALIAADKNVRDTMLSTKLDDYAFLYEMGKITKAEYINYLKGIQSTLAPSTKQFKDLERTIKGLNDDISGDLKFNLPTSLSLPTLYEVRRMNQAGSSNSMMPAQNTYAPSVTVNVGNINNGVDANNMLQAIRDVVDPSRNGYGPRRY